MSNFWREFFEDPGGKSSMSRLTMLLLCLCACAVSAAWVIGVLYFPEKMSTQVTSGFAAVLGALVANGVVALRERTTKEHREHGDGDSEGHL
jgi:hypothetical protein